jgi:outer membrane protein TolC
MTDNPRRAGVLLLALCISAAGAQAQSITLDEFLGRLTQTHPAFVKDQLTADIEAERRNGYLGARDWNIASSAFYVHEEPAIALMGPERTDAFSISGGVDKAFWSTGGRFSASFTSTRADLKLDPVYGFPDSYYENELAVGYIHPLLRNRGGLLDRLEYDLKGFDIDYESLQALEAEEAFLADAAGKFLDWRFLREQIGIIEERLRLSEEELERTTRKREANLVDQADVIRAEDAVRIWRQNQVLAVSQRNALRAELAELLQEDLAILEPAFDLYEIQELVTLDEAVTELTARSRLLEALRVRVEQLRYARRGYEETAKPDLHLVAELSTKNADESLGESWAMDKPDASIGVQLSLPLERTTARSQQAATDLRIAQLEETIRDLTLTLTSALTNLHIRIEEMHQVLRLNQEQIQSSRERTEEELKLYNQGRGDLTFVIMSRDSEQNAKLTYAQNALTYHKLLTEYLSLTDQLHQPPTAEQR